MTNSRKKGSGRKFIITKDIGLKIEILIKEDDLLNLEDITVIGLVLESLQVLYQLIFVQFSRYSENGGFKSKFSFG